MITDPLQDQGAPAWAGAKDGGAKCDRTGQQANVSKFAWVKPAEGQAGATGGAAGWNMIVGFSCKAEVFNHE